MKIAFKISILLNLLLLGCLAFPWLGTAPVSSESKPPAVSLPIATAASVPAPLATPTPAQSEPLKWDQLYAQDYHFYVKNLRAIGCPETALRAIVSADVHTVIQQQADSLKGKISSLTNASLSAELAVWADQKNWKNELLQLPAEEAAMVADYLGENTNPVSTTPASAIFRRTDKVANGAVTLPLIAQRVNLTALNLEPAQVQAITDLQNSFLQKIGGPNQDPKDPDYQARWRKAQAETDNLLQGMLGDQAYQEYQLLTSARSQADQTGNAQSSDPATSSTPIDSPRTF